MGYAPKRNTKMMLKLPQYKAHLKALELYLNAPFKE
jgi:hypothetical protein